MGTWRTFGNVDAEIPLAVYFGVVLRRLTLRIAIAVNYRLVPRRDCKWLTFFVPYGLLSSSVHPSGGVVSGFSNAPYVLEDDADVSGSA